MAGLLERVRHLRAQGLPIHVFLFDGSYTDAAVRDRGMAETIATHVRAHPEALMMVLTGEVHAARGRGSPWDPAFLPMGWHLVERGLRVRSLGRATPAGTVWTCSSASVADCRQRDVKAMGALPSGATSGIELLPELSPRGYDGLYATPTLTASPPARSLGGPRATRP